MEIPKTKTTRASPATIMKFVRRMIMCHTDSRGVFRYATDRAHYTDKETVPHLRCNDSNAITDLKIMIHGKNLRAG